MKPWARVSTINSWVAAEAWTLTSDKQPLTAAEARRAGSLISHLMSVGTLLPHLHPPTPLLSPLLLLMLLLLPMHSTTKSAPGRKMWAQRWEIWRRPQIHLFLSLTFFLFPPLFRSLELDEKCLKWKSGNIFLSCFFPLHLCPLTVYSCSQ